MTNATSSGLSDKQCIDLALQSGIADCQVEQAEMDVFLPKYAKAVIEAHEKNRTPQTEEAAPSCATAHYCCSRCCTPLMCCPCTCAKVELSEPK